METLIFILLVPIVIGIYALVVYHLREREQYRARRMMHSCYRGAPSDPIGADLYEAARRVHNEKRCGELTAAIARHELSSRELEGRFEYPYG